MPTMTQHALDRRLHRHSNDEPHVEGRIGRRSLTVPYGSGEANKENFGVHFMSSPFGNSSLIALQDLSNVHGKSPQRRSFSEGSGPRQATPQRAAGTPLMALRCLPARTVAALEDSQLSSSRMGDTTLDRMLDAIIESARKEVRCKFVTAPVSTVTTTATATLTPTTTVDGDWSESSVHEMEVRTPTHLKRQRVVRRKNQHKSVQLKANPRNTPMQEPSLHSTKRCLSFSSSGTSSDLEDEFNVGGDDKRGSMASVSSGGSSSAGVSIASSEGSGNRGGGAGATRGSLDLATTYNAQQQQLNVHVIRCRELQRAHGSGAINAYVKVALSGGTHSSRGFQRTAVHRHSSRPYFDQRFCFNVQPHVAQAATVQLQLAVWHRDRHLKRSEFLGCSTLPLSALLQQNHSGSFKLQSQACLNNCRSHQAEQQQAPQEREEEQEVSQPRSSQNRPTTVNSSLATVAIISNMATTAAQQKTNAIVSVSAAVNDDVISIDTMAGAGNGDEQQQPMVLSKKALHQRDADENLFLRFLELDPPADGNANTSGGATASNEKGAGSGNNVSSANAANANHMNGSSGGSGRRCSTVAGVRQSGRTPFTMTKRLTRTEERGFGFSIVWTHPPRVEKVEAGLSADRCGILPGDYVIFVDKHNVVTMPEADVLNLIRSQGSTLTLEIFRRSGAGASTATATITGSASLASSQQQQHHQPQQHTQRPTLIAGSSEEHTMATNTTLMMTSTTAPTVPATPLQRTGSNSAARILGNNMSRPATACSGTTSSIEAAKRRLHLPQVTFSKESIVPITDNRRRFLLQLISREQNFTVALHFGIQRFVQPLQERKDLISPNDHRTLFQNIDELLRISEDVLEQLCSNEQDQEPHMNFASRVYLSKTTAICAAYKKYCNGIKRADCVLVNKSRQTGSEFVAFITEPAVPRKRPDLTMFIHRPLQHFREILKLMQLLASNCHVDTEEHKNFTTVIGELQAAYREITVSSGLMEPLGEGRPLLTLQDLESRMVFTKCKPFTLAVQGRQWIFGGDLSRVEGRSIKPYWTLLFSDIIVFAKVSRDRVLFITEEPIPIANVVDSCFHMRKKTTEFRLTVDPNGRLAESPTGYCAPDLTRTPKRGARRKSLILRAPSLELKAVWQNLLQRQIFLVNAALGSTPLSSPLDSPDVLNTLVPLSDIGLTSASMGSKLPSLDSINLKQQKQQVRLFRSKRLDSSDSYENLQRLASALVPRGAGGGSNSAVSGVGGSGGGHTHCASTQTAQISCASLPSRTTSPARKAIGHSHDCCSGGGSVPNGVGGGVGVYNTTSSCLSFSGSSSLTAHTHTQMSAHGSADHLPGSSCKCLTAIPEASSEQQAATVIQSKPPPPPPPTRHAQKLLEFSLSSVGRSFIDEASNVVQHVSLTTPETPTPNISPSSQVCNSDAFSNDFVPPASTSCQIANIPLAEFGGSWDLLELDLQLHEVNLDTCYDTDVEECIFMGDTITAVTVANNDGGDGDEDSDDDSIVVDDPFGMLPTKPTPPDSLDL
ncbi:uncharacterized protein LOC115629905 isoform X2 [Scaptodrosophila lebanonensis]|uniref:Uncharacterized protein LOC115629905 isoform X2 n=1 Tax=Drosophila lebanonensis TaxID=7225 RepID=A0A6J2U111_DROLE|nr:uncharacterized protein LOC115629905 isoform X2 [Scaptodrosophila lebanonensis]